MHYSSKDFPLTRPDIVTEVPEKLVHRQVERAIAAKGGESFARERQHPVFVVDLPSRVISMTIGALEPGHSTRKHRHTYETILYILEGNGFTEIENRRVDWSAGDAVYVPVWAWHRHQNAGRAMCRYVACENAPLLQNLGVALREEAGER
jgi:gentisate 1,2-dioxygenase/4-hydroxy-tetrahydrodipicolinate synthase